VGVAPPPYGYTPPPRGTDGLAIAALVTGLLGLALIPLGLGIAALRRIKRSGAAGGGLAIAGIVLGAVGTIGWGVFIWFVAAIVGSEEFRDGFSEAYVEEFNSQTGYDVGVCFNPQASPTRVQEIDCATSHPAEVVGVKLMTDAGYPGDESVDAAAVEFCYEAFAAYIGVEYDDSSLGMRYFYPTQATWALGDRQIVCWAEAGDGAPLEGSVQGSAK
jgi:hypothetical protein